MVDSLRFTADDDLDDFGYEEEQIDVVTEVGEYGPEDEDEDELAQTGSGAGSLHSRPRRGPPFSSPRGAAPKEAGEESRRRAQAGCRA